MVKRFAFCGIVVLLILTMTQGQDDPKQEKKQQTPKEQFTNLTKEFTSERQKIIEEFQKTKGEEQQKVLTKYNNLGKDFADKFYKLAEDNPKDPVATDALFWILTNAPGLKKAEDKLVTLIAEMPLSALKQKLLGAGGTSSLGVLEAVLKRAEKDDKDPLAGDVLGWVASSRMYFGPGGSPGKTVERATELLIEKFPNNPALERLCMILGRSGSQPDAESLKKIIEKVSSAKVKADASLALGSNLASQLDSAGDNQEKIDKIAAEAEKYFAQAIELFDKEKMNAKKDSAQKELKAFQTLRVGKEAPEISGKDLDGKEFKLSDYRGKVVLLDFWGNW